MTQENKLLLSELSARLPYGVKASFYGFEEECECIDIIDGIYPFDNEISIGQYGLKVEEVKPYLFPLSSIDEKTKNFLKWKLTTPKYDSFDEETLEDLINNNVQVVHYCYENHIDINGFIEKGLAKDASGLNIY